jgi:predicted alpha/beta hydrolase
VSAGSITLARNTASDGLGQFSAHTIGLSYGGKALGLLADAVFYNAVRRYMNAIGALTT